MDFSDKGKKGVPEGSRRDIVGARGRTTRCPNQSPLDASQHFAIVLDNELVSTPYIDFQREPRRHRRATGAQISGGFTLQSAQDLAKFLKIGALPIRLELISRSQVSASLGKQALDQGLDRRHRGLPRSSRCSCRLLPRARPDRRLRPGIYALYFYALVKLIPVVLTLPGIAGLILGPRRRGGREHRHLRTRQGRDADAGRSTGLRHRRGATRRASRRSSTPTSSRCSSRSSCSSSLTAGVRGLRAHARPRHDRLAVHRGARHPGDPAVAARHSVLRRSPRSARLDARPLARGLHGRLEVVLLDVRA